MIVCSKRLAGNESIGAICAETLAGNTSDPLTAPIFQSAPQLAQ
jgi:hypothetical protein